MKISDRDKKLILLVLLAAIIALPIFLFIRPKNNQIKEMEEELVGLNERYDYLKGLSEKQKEYEDTIVELNAKRDAMVADFAGGVKKENVIMFLRAIELSENPVYMSVVSFGEVTEEVVTEDTIDENGNYVEGLTSIVYPTTITYRAEYKDIKAFLNYIFTYKDKMNVSAISMNLNGDTNQIEGTILLEQFAVSGNGKEVEDASIPSIKHGSERLFKLELDDQGNPKTYESAHPDEATNAVE